MRDVADHGASPLEEFAARHAAPCPAGADPFDWAVDALDDLARIVAAVGPVATQVSGRQSDQLDRRVQDLVTAIVAHRNALMRGDASGRVA